MSEMYMDTSIDSKARVYINRCLRDIRKGNKDKAKLNFERAWKIHCKENCTWDTENALLVLRENWHPTTGCDAVGCGAKGDYYEKGILERQERYDWGE